MISYFCTRPHISIYLFTCKCLYIEHQSHLQINSIKLYKKVTTILYNHISVSIILAIVPTLAPTHTMGPLVTTLAHTHTMGPIVTTLATPIVPLLSTF